MTSHKKTSKIVQLLFAALVFLVPVAAWAQIDTGIQYGSATGLGGGDIRAVIGQVIQVVLGFLGVVALALIVYAGFLWMTAGGEEEKVTRAKQIITQAAIGLAIVLSAYALSTFIISRLMSATDANGGGGGPGCVGPGCNGGGLPSGQFGVVAITPPGSKPADFSWPKNSKVTVVFRNGAPDPATVAGSISVSAGGVPVSGTIVASGNKLVFTATAVCTENSAYTCLPGNANVSVSISPSITSVYGKSIYCGLCSASFKTGDFIDTQNPLVSISTPTDGESVSVAAFVPIIANASDDSSVASVDFLANNVALDSAGSAPWQINWSTTDYPVGSTVSLTAVATDAVGNTAMSSAVDVVVRPAHCFNTVQDGGETGLNCGDGCGACPGGSCKKNSDCASGLCENGVCINRPRIDSVAPVSGGPGTLITISGASFGAQPGKVVFLGDRNDPSDDKTADRYCGWSGFEIVTAVPEGAKTGPIEVTNSDNLSDRTDDAFGNASIADFIVDASVHPGICTISPSTGPAGAVVAVNGSGFGDSQGASSVSVAGRPADAAAWTASNFNLTIPNILGGTWPVVATVNGIDSNPVAFSVPIAQGGAPTLVAIDPKTGPVGEYVTITGTNFGTSPGKIAFVSGNDSVLGGTDFPAACAKNFWRTASVTVKVPAGLPEGVLAVKLTRADSVSADNTLPFTLVSGNPNPGICSVKPASGPAGTSYELSGERLGNDRGKVIFRDQAEGTSQISGWNDSMVGGSVPATAVTGRVFANSAAGGQSNSLNFAVVDCRKDSKACTGSDECCTDGSCRAPNADGSSGCVAASRQGAYAYRFSTGVIPLAPAVVEEVTCTVRSQSPSPWKDVADACVNSAVAVRFTLPMDPATLTAAGSLSLSACGTAEAYDAKACNGSVTGTLERVGAGQELEDGIQFSPSGLNPNTWYRATVSKNARSISGVAMNDDYVWHFRVRNSSELCAISSITVSPANNKLTDLYVAAARSTTENVSWSKYKANPANASCNLLKCASYDWSWSADSTRAAVSPTDTCEPEVQALAETPPAQPVQITATAQSKSGTGRLAIEFPAPRVIAQWPDCQAACLDAQVAAQFNTSIMESSFTSATAKLFKCNNETCKSPVEVLTGGVTATNVDGHIAVIHALNSSGVAGLDPNSFYRVVILGGPSGIKSSAGALLDGTNYSYAGAPAYTWIFRTSDKRCIVDSVAISPATITTSIVGSYHPVTAIPKTAPDSCSAGGQKIDPDALSWAWSANPAVPGAADLYAAGRLNASPLASSYATASCLNAGSRFAEPRCGNGVVENGKGVAKAAGQEAFGGGEECDLGATLNGATNSGCSTSCLLTGDPDKSCGNSTIDSYVLGDGRTNVKEQCDAGKANGQPGSGCSEKCSRLGSSSTSPTSICGNADVADGEQCDDGNAVGGDGCSSDCLDEGSVSGTFSVCGNKTKEDGEDCDPANGVFANGTTTYGCDQTCRFTGTPLCVGGVGSNCCGNSTSDAGEDPICDQGWSKGAPVLAEGCDSSCRKAGASLSYSVPSVCGTGSAGLGKSFDPGPKGTAIDGAQFAHAVGAGTQVDTSGRMTTTITATAGGKSGTGQFFLQCGYKSDSECSRFGNLRLGNNSCCYPPLAVVRSIPTGLNVCRNPLVEVEFDRTIDSSSIEGKMVLAYQAPAAGCPTGTALQATGLRKVWQEIAAFFQKMVAFITGRKAVAAPSWCAVPNTIVTVDDRDIGGGVIHSFARLAVSAALAPLSSYRVSLEPSVKSSAGVPLGARTEWTFTTGTDVCTLDAIRVEPNRYLFSQQYSPGSVDVNAVKSFTATAVHIDLTGRDQVIAPIAGTYDWQTAWSSSDTSLVNGVVGGNIGALPTNASSAMLAVASAKNGEAVLTADAKITADKILTPSTLGASVSGKADITVMLCKLPWPARTANGSWSPYVGSAAIGDNKYNYSFYYCRDGASGQPDLPALKETPVVPANTSVLRASGKILDQYLFTYVGGSTAPSGEGIGLRIASNPLHQKPSVWYSAQGFRGSASATSVDGYEAVQDAGTVYVNAPSVNPAGASYTNIYALALSQGAGSQTQNVYNQIVKNVRFAANLNPDRTYLYDDSNACGPVAKSCSDDKTKSCTTKTDCKSSGATCDAVVCSSDLDCSLVVAGSVCGNPRSKIRRDVKRLSDLRLIGDRLASVKKTTGLYPQMASGSFLAGRTVSVWPSWSGELASEMAGGPPNDPVNRLATCPTGSDYETATCWSQSKLEFACPAGSRVYQYSTDPVSGFMLDANAETTIFAPATSGILCNYSDSVSCNADSLCSWRGGACTRLVGSVCAATTAIIGSGSAVCGNGALEPGEACDKGLRYADLDCGGGRKAGQACSSDCQTMVGSCAKAVCGDSIIETGEVCDNGSLNGTYGHCNASCSGIGQYCGDSIIQQGEACDLGAQNGQYDSRCSFDCHSQGEYCGDAKVNGPEQCDGNSETSAAVEGLETCSVENGYQTARTRNCTATCGWGDWGGCQASGSCGNGVKDGGELCDLGGANSDTAACTKECKNNVCGDARVWSGHEGCDNGVANMSPTDAAGIAALKNRCSLASCYYCTNTCAVQAVTGPYCGDNIVQPQSGEECDSGTANVDASDPNAVKALPAGTPYCTSTCQNAVTPMCGDGKIDSGEQCDGGPACSGTCQCMEDVISSGTATQLSDAAGTVTGPAVVLSDAFAGVYSPAYWIPAYSGAKFVWSFVEGIGQDPPNFTTSDTTQYFKAEFTLSHQPSRVILKMTADNNIDSVKIDGVVIPGAISAAFSNSYSYDITSYVKTSWQQKHTLLFQARNVNNGQPSLRNPAALIYQVVSTPQCGGPVVDRCGNETREGDEQCDGRDLGMNTDCKTLGGFDIGSLSCNSNCTYNTSQCQICSIGVTGRVVDSHTSSGIPNQVVRAVCAGTALGETYTDGSGNYRLNLSNAPTAFAACNRIIKVESDSNAAYCYNAIQAVSVDLTAQTACLGATAPADSLVLTSPVEVGQWKAVLTWDPSSSQNLNIHMREGNASPASPGGAWGFQHVLTSGSSARYCLVSGAVRNDLVCTKDSDCPSGSPCVNMAADNGNAYLDVDATHGPGPETITITDHDDMRGGIGIDGTGAGSSGSNSPVVGATLSVWTPNCQLQQYKSDLATGDSTLSWWWVVDFYHVNGELNIVPHGSPNGTRHSTCVNTSTSTQPPW